MQLISFEWRDAKSIDGWGDEKNLDEELPLIQSAGYLIKGNEEALFISSAVHIENDGTKTFNGLICVPRKLIVSNIICY